MLLTSFVGKLLLRFHLTQNRASVVALGNDITAVKLLSVTWEVPINSVFERNQIELIQSFNLLIVFQNLRLTIAVVLTEYERGYM